MADFLAKVVGTMMVVSSAYVLITTPAVLAGFMLIFGILAWINPRI